VTQYDALVVVSFGGPEGPDDVQPFLENVTRGRAVPAARLAEVAAHYQEFGGVSPINAHTRRLVEALQGSDLALPIYWGNRNWHPLLADTVARMAEDGITRALAFVTSAFSSYPSCRQYLQDIAAARAAVGIKAPAIDKLRPFFNHPGFLEPVTARVVAAVAQLPTDRRDDATLVFTAHSIPKAMAATCDYEEQLRDGAEVVAGLVPGRHRWTLAFQSRSGPSTSPWLGPDIGDALDTLASEGGEAVVVVPLGFVCDHMEVIYDLDVLARRRADELGVAMARAATVGDHPRFVAMVGELVSERSGQGGHVPRLALGRLGPRPDPCAGACCPLPTR
jgi:ferrochelatase